ncbi:MAG: hypothetical protein ABL895_21830 [Cyclobacteriaceae bacterium]
MRGFTHGLISGSRLQTHNDFGNSIIARQYILYRKDHGGVGVLYDKSTGDFS